VDLAAIQQHRAQLNAQEIGDPSKRSKGWQKWDHEPVFNPETLKLMVEEGVQALTDMQLSDGGWGWFSGYSERSAPHTTATVVRGLLVAKANGAAMIPGVIERGVQRLVAYEQSQLQRLQNAATQTRPYKRQAGNLDALVAMVIAEAQRGNSAMLDFLFRDRTELSVYALSMLGLTYDRRGEVSRRDQMIRSSLSLKCRMMKTNPLSQSWRQSVVVMVWQ